MPRVIVSPAATHDLHVLRDWLAGEFSEAVADRKLAHLHQLLKRLESFPQLGRRRDSVAAGLRSFTIRPNVILYRIVNPDVVDIIRIVDGRQDWEARFRVSSEEEEI